MLGRPKCLIFQPNNLPRPTIVEPKPFSNCNRREIGNGDRAMQMTSFITFASMNAELTTYRTSLRNRRIRARSNAQHEKIACFSVEAGAWLYQHRSPLYRVCWETSSPGRQPNIQTKMP